MNFFIKNFSINKILLLFALFSFCSLSFAYLSQYFFDLKPCILCLYQRIPFFIILIICIFSLFFSKDFVRKIVYFLCLLMFFVNSAIAFYHFGVEKKVFQMTKNCKNDFENAKSIEELKVQIANADLSKCDEIQFSVFGFSMAGWNFLFSSIFFIFGVVFYRILSKKHQNS